MTNNKEALWLISRNHNGTTWKVTGNDCEDKLMFTDDGELLTVIAAYSKDSCDYSLAKKHMEEAKKNFVNKDLNSLSKVYDNNFIKKNIKQESDNNYFILAACMLTLILGVLIGVTFL